MERNKIYHGNNLDILKTFEDNSIDSIVTDPPYGISFMNKKWDYDVPTVEFWKEALRVLKPGGHALVACGTRTQHRMAVNLEDAGFEIRDIVAWVYGSGFPKSHDISKAIESTLLKGNSHSTSLRKVEQDGNGESYTLKGKNNGIMGEDRIYDRKEFSPSTDEAKQWQGWGTALKPAMELWTLCRKPLQGTVAQNVLKYGVGGINIDGCRIPLVGEWDKSTMGTFRKAYDNPNKAYDGTKGNIAFGGNKLRANREIVEKYGRFPANFIHDGSDEVLALFPNTQQGGSITKTYEDNSPLYGDYKQKAPFESYGDSGSAARFFYTAKASQTERNWGLGEFDEVSGGSYEFRQDGSLDGKIPKRKNIHPTVKPIDLMRYLVRLVTPKGGVCLDPFMGSGTTAVACKAEKFDYIGCELSSEYIKIAEARIKAETVQYDIFDFLED